MKSIATVFLGLFILVVAGSARAEHEGQIQILLLGDSATESSIPRKIAPQEPQFEDVVRILLAAEGDLPPANVINVGLSGEYIRRLLDSGRYERAVAKLPGLDYIFIRYGGNDYAKREDFPVNFPQDFRELLARLRQDHPAAMLIPTTNIPWGEDLELEDTWPKKANRLIRQVAAEENLTCFDLYPRYAAEQAKGPNMLNYRRFPLAKIPEKLHELARPYLLDSQGKDPHVVVLDNRLDAHFGGLPGWFGDRHPNLAGYRVIADETARFLTPIIRERRGKCPASTRIRKGPPMNLHRILLGIVLALTSESVALTNELANPEFEQTAAGRLVDWTPHGRGYALDAAEVHAGKFAIRCETANEQEGTGIAQVIRYERPDRRPIIVGGWSKADGVVGGGGDYCVFLDVIYDDGTPWWGKTAAWTRGTHDWEYTAEVYWPQKPVREIRAYVFLRRVRGKAWFDDVFVHRGGLHATQVRVMSDFPRCPQGQRIGARLTEPVEWRAALLDSGGRELASTQGRGETIAWTWRDAAESRLAAFRLTAEGRDGRRLDLTTPVAVPERRQNPVREGYVVWGENSMRKVYPTEYPPEDRRAEQSVSLARNESEGLQLAITGADGVTLRDVQVSVGPLTNERGEAFPPEAVTAHLVGYIYVETPSGHPAAPAVGNWCPEVLLPLRPFEVVGGRTQTVWVNFHATEAVPPGTYRGRVLVKPAAAAPAELAVRVHVRRFTLPRCPRLKTAFAMMDGYTRAAYGEITPALRRQCLELMLSHRLNPDDISRTDPPAVADLRYAKDRGLTAFNILNLVPKPKGNPLWTCYAELKDYPADFCEELARRLDDYVRELRQHGLSELAYVYGFDERGPEYDELIRGICKFLKQRYPEVRTFTTAGYMYQKRRTAPPEDQDFMDWYCPLTAAYNPDLSARLRQQGKQVWWYVCCGPQHPYANFAAMDYPTIEGRLLGWMSYGFQADGLLFWHVNLWHPNGIIAGSDPYLDWKPACVARMTGDGCLTYPTPAGPVSSIRLENVRDGLEDYDYLALLADAQGREAAQKYVERLVHSMTDFSRDPAALAAVRDQIADQIEAGR